MRNAVMNGIIRSFLGKYRIVVTSLVVRRHFGSSNEVQILGVVRELALAGNPHLSTRRDNHVFVHWARVAT